jgi:Pyruvate/2-oxoacid:ferredoxin oxidoreductase gamma subunit
VVCNANLLTPGWGEAVEADGFRVFPVAADELALELGSPLSAGFVLLGAYAAITGLAGPDALVEAMTKQVPSYRSKSIEANAAAIRRGFDLGPPMGAPAFPESATMGVSRPPC